MRVQRGEIALNVDHADLAGVGFGLAALSPSGTREACGAATLNSSPTKNWKRYTRAAMESPWLTPLSFCRGGIIAAS